MKSKKYFIIITLIISLLRIYGIESYGFDIETILGKINQRIGTHNEILESKNKKNSQNIYTSTLSTIEKNDNTAMLHSIENLTKSIGKNQCQINSRDIIRILLTTPNFTEEFYKNGNIPLSYQGKDNQSNIIAECERILNCGKDQKNYRKVTNASQSLIECQRIVLDGYNENKITELYNLGLSLVNENDNIYIDGDDNNGLFDIMIDIENINKYLLDPGNTLPTLPKTIFYSMPSVINSSTNGGGSSTNSSSSNNNSQLNTPNLNNNQNSTTSITNNNQQNNNQNLNNNSSINTNNGLSLTSLGQEMSTFIGGTHSNIEESSLQADPLGNIPRTTISQAICFPEEKNQYESGIPASLITNIEKKPTIEVSSKDIASELESLQNEIIDIIQEGNSGPIGGSNQVTGIQTTNPIITTIGGIGFGTTLGSAMPAVTTPYPQECQGMEGTEQLICEGKACIASCNQIKNVSEKAICISQCLCGEASTANDMLRIKICRVPAQSTTVKAGKKIQSVEEAVDEINNIFQKLKQGGALNKRTKTEEFLDSSFSTTKLDKIIAFDIFVTVKPIYDKIISGSEKTKAIKKYSEALSLNNMNGKRSEGVDKNKYMVSGLVGNIEQLTKYCDGNGGVYNPVTQKCDRSIKNSIIKNEVADQQKNILNDLIYNLLSEHYTFWDQAYNQIVEFKIFSENLKIKAEAAK